MCLGHIPSDVSSQGGLEQDLVFATIRLALPISAAEECTARAGLIVCT